MTDTLAAALGSGYRVERELGQGGMATVYLAQDLKHHSLQGTGTVELVVVSNWESVLRARMGTSR